MANGDKPLAGRTVLVTRPRRQAAGLAAGLRRLGARVLTAPAIRIAAPASWRKLDAALRSLASYDTVVFTSANGVESFFARAREVLGRGPRRPRRLYAIGPATARALAGRGWRGARVPGTSYEGGALARALGDVRGRRILIPRARTARGALPRILARKGAYVAVVEAYRAVGDAAGGRRIREAVRSGSVDAVTFTSSSTAERFFAAAGPAAARKLLRRALAASIGPVTSGALRRLGVRRVVEASPYTSVGLVKALERAAVAGAL